MVLVKTVETGNKSRCMTEATYVLQRKLIKDKCDLELFPEQVGPRLILSLQSFDYFGTSEYFSGKKKKTKKNLN